MVPMCRPTIVMDGPHVFNRDGWSPYGLRETIDTCEEGAEKEGVGRHLHVCSYINTSLNAIIKLASTCTCICKR